MRRGGMRVRFQGMNSGDREEKKTPEAWLDLRSPVPLGTPSAWLFLIRLHACRAGLRFARRNQYTLDSPSGQKEINNNQSGTTVSSRRGLVRAAELISGCAKAPPKKRWVVS